MNLSRNTVTFIVLASVVLGLSGYDFGVLAYCGVDWTISHVLRDWNVNWPLLGLLMSFTAGVLLGHFFWGIPNDKRNE